MPLWVILCYSTYSFVSNSKVVYDSLHGQSYIILLYIFTIVEYSLFATFIYKVLQKPYLKKALLACSFLFTAFCLFNVFFQPTYRFDSLQTSIEALILLIFCIFFLFEQISKPELVFIYSSYKFWVITGILIYLAATFFLYGFAASMSLKQREEWWVISHISNILKNLLFAIAIIVYVKTPEPSITRMPDERGYQPFLN